MRLLFIGGPRDGEQLDMPAAAGGRLEFVETGSDHPADARTVVYVRTSLAGSSRRFDLMALEGMTGDEIVTRLINGYGSRR